MNNDTGVITAFFDTLAQNDIRYVVLKSIARGLPGTAPERDSIEVLVHQEHKERFEAVIAQSGYAREDASVGKEQGWVFGYAMPPFQFWTKEDAEPAFRVLAHFILSCRSLMSKAWIPISAPVQDSVWKNRVFDETKRRWVMDEKSILIYLLVKSVFDENAFSDENIREIEERKQYLSEAGDLLRALFFKFTDRLMELVSASRYDAILPEYIAFDQY